MKLKPVSLPFDNVVINQDLNSQAVSSDSEFLYRTIISEYKGNRGAKSIKALELGTGNGIIAIMLALTCKHWQISALEAQIPLYMLAKENLRISKTAITLLLADLRKPESLPASEAYELVYANPPYYPPVNLRLSPSPAKAFSRYELLCDMNDILSSCKKLLHPEGYGYILYPASRSVEFRAKAEKTGLQVLAVFSGENCNRGDAKKKNKNIFKVCHRQ